MDAHWYRWMWSFVFGISVLTSTVLCCHISGVVPIPVAMVGQIDTGVVTRIMIGLFSASLAINCFNTLRLFRELKLVSRGLRCDPTSSKLRLVGDGLLGQHAATLNQIYDQTSEGTVSQEVSLGCIRNALVRREWIVRTACQLLMTMGLVGTVLGLGGSLAGLSQTIRSVPGVTLSPESSSSPATNTSAGSGFSGGLDSAIGGMSGAFSTTLLGAVLGGVLLKLLTGSTQNFSELLLDKIELVSETELAPLLRSPSGRTTANNGSSPFYREAALHQESQSLTQMVVLLQQIANHLGNGSEVPLR